MKISVLKRYSKFIGIFLFIYILYKVDIGSFWLILKETNLSYLLIGIILIPPTLLFRILRWKALIDSLPAAVTFLRIGRIFLKSLLLGVATPGKVGEFWKAKYLSDASNVPIGQAFYTAVFDKIIDVILILLVGIAVVIVLLRLYGAEIGLEIIVFGAALLIFIIYFLVKKKNARKCAMFLAKIFIPEFAREKTDSFLGDFFKGMEKLNLALFLKLSGWTLMYYSTSVLAYYFIALSLGINFPIWYLFLIVAPIWFAAGLPISISGLGTREAVCIFFFSVLGIAPIQAIAFSLLVLGHTVLMAFPGAILFLREKNGNH
jgi:uncharacterized protein (TIRG00374 family)